MSHSAHEFDRYKDTYRAEVNQSIRFIGQEQEFFTLAKVRHILDFSRSFFGDLSQRKILDVGCGIGSTDRFLVPHFGEVCGIDPSQGSIEVAQQRVSGATYTIGDGTAIPHADGTFDLTFAICVMHHVPPTQWAQVAQEMARVTKPHGLVAIFEHNPYNPLTRLAVHRCEFDQDAVLLSMRKTRRLLHHAGLSIQANPYILFFPWRATLFATLEQGLTWLPLGAQYYVLAQKPRLGDSIAS